MSSFVAKLLIIGVNVDVLGSLLVSSNSGFFYYNFGLLRLKLLMPTALPPNNELGCALFKGFYVDGLFAK